jgi:hypothetical protein
VAFAAYRPGGSGGRYDILQAARAPSSGEVERAFLPMVLATPG